MIGRLNLKAMICGVVAICSALMGFNGYGGGKDEPLQAVKCMNSKTFGIVKQAFLLSPKENVLLSPYTIQQAFGMVLAGANGQTAAEITQVFGFSESPESLLGQINKSLDRSSKAKVVTCNAVFFDAKEKILPSYAATLKEYANAKLMLFNPACPDAVAAKINAMVEKQTEGMISNSISPHDISPQTAMMLLSTFYFKSGWAMPFDESETQDREFRLANGKKCMVPMMTMTKNVDYFAHSDDDIHGIILPYNDPRFQMIAIQPKSGKNTLTQILEYLEAGKLERWLALSSDTQKTKILLPKLSVTDHRSLKSILSNSGLKLPFLQAADFAKVNGRSNLFLSDVFHTVKLEVNEKETDAAAATSIQLLSLAENEPRYNTFYADSPFLMIIRDVKTGIILFCGIINDPQ